MSVSFVNVNTMHSNFINLLLGAIEPCYEHANKRTNSARSQHGHITYTVMI